uniref:Uncharacterized protein n=1 Tax=Eutreptiella gymnastica TaxID=73025 RepID=A0A7S1J2H3_9EUGL
MKSYLQGLAPCRSHGIRFPATYPSQAVGGACHRSRSGLAVCIIKAHPTCVLTEWSWAGSPGDQQEQMIVAVDPFLQPTQNNFFLLAAEFFFCIADWSHSFF